MTSRMPKIISASARAAKFTILAVSRMACCKQFLEGSRSIFKFSQTRAALSKFFVDSRSPLKVFRRLEQRFQNILYTRVTANLIIFCCANARADEKSIHFCLRKVLAHPRIQLFMRES